MAGTSPAMAKQSCSLQRELKRGLLQPVALRFHLLGFLVPDIELPVARTVAVAGRHLDRPTGQSGHVDLQGLDRLVELLACARPAATLERGFGKLAECPAGNVHAGERLR